MRPWRSPSRFVDLDAVWQYRLDDLLISLHSLLRTIPTLLFLICASLSLVFVSRQLATPALQWRNDYRHFTHRMVQQTDHPNPSHTLLANRSTNTNLFSTPEHQPTNPPSHNSTPYQFFPPLHPQRTPVPLDSTLRLHYSRLATLYLLPFSNATTVSRASYMTPFLHQPGICSGCFLLQIKNGTLYVHDPRAVRAVMSDFRELRMREAIHWVKSAVSRGVVDDTELVISTTDGVPTTSRKHSYRMPEPEDVKRPIFSVVQCNVSDNIPFPMVLADAMRRGLGGSYWKKGKGLLREWDEIVTHAGQVHGREVPWSGKVSKAVFRGSIRVSAMFRDSALFDKLCDAAGRTGLWHTALRHVEALRSFDMQTGQRWRIWPLPSYWFSSRTEPVLDVRVSGTCGSRIYVHDGMSMEKQNLYKYVIHAEGNSFWADRLIMQLFGSSAVIKQSTPCGMFFEPMLRPYVHYIPVDFSFRHLVRQTMWARANDDKVRGIVWNARKFAEEYLSTAGVQTYVDELLVQYTSLLEDRDIRIEAGAVQLYP